jgi:hypothetical protein
VETDSFSGDLGGVNQVLQDLFMHLLQSTGAGALLLLSGASGGLAHHSSLANEDDMAIGEFLF